MALERLISINVDSDAANTKLKTLLSTLKSVDSELSGGATAAPKKAGKSLNDYAGVMSNLSRDIIKTNGSISKQETALARYDTAIRSANKSLAEGVYDQDQYNKAVSDSKTIYDNRISSIKKSETATKSGRKTLNDYVGVIENETRILQKSAGTKNYAEAATLRYDTSVRQLNQAFATGKISQNGLNTALATATMRYDEAYKGASLLDAQMAKGRNTFRAMRGATSQLSYQFQDIAVQMQMGTAGATIFTQQFPQIASVFGPAGAVVGVIGAIAGAIAGPLISSMLGADDSAEKLKKTLEQFDSILEKNADGVHVFSEAFYEMEDASKAASQLFVGLSKFKYAGSLDALSKQIKTNTNSISSSFFGLIDNLDIAELSESLNVIDESSIKSLEQYRVEVKEVGKAQANEAKTLTERNRILRESQVQYRDIKKALDEVADATKGVSKEYGLTSDGAQQLLSSLDAARLDPTVENLNQLDSTLFDLLQTVKTGKQGQAFADFAQSMLESTEAGRKLHDQMTTLKNGPFGDLELYVDSMQLSSAALNSEFDETSSLIYSIGVEQKRLNDLVKAGAVNGSTAQSYLDENTVKIIGEAVAEYDTLAKRQALINDLSARGVVLTKEELNAINEYAQKQNFVYQRQISFSKSIYDILVQSTDQTIKAANETEAWADLSGQVSEIFGRGAEGYADSISGYNASLEGLVTSTFGNLEDALVSWAETGKISASDLADSIISDLLRIQIQQSLASGIGGFNSFFGGGTGAPAATDTSGFIGYAKGGAFDESGVTKFAKGGITGLANTIQTTPKRFANGSGLVGEAAQAEGIFPLTRTSGGDLGVKAVGGSGSPVFNMTITNESGSDMNLQQTNQTQNSSGGFDINMIATAVNKVISSGKSDKALKTRFNLTGKAN